MIVEGAKEVKSYNLPVGSHIIIDGGDEVKAGRLSLKSPVFLES